MMMSHYGQWMSEQPFLMSCVCCSKVCNEDNEDTVMTTGHFGQWMGGQPEALQHALPLLLEGLSHTKVKVTSAAIASLKGIAMANLSPNPRLHPFLPDILHTCQVCCFIFRSDIMFTPQICFFLSCLYTCFTHLSNVFSSYLISYKSDRCVVWYDLHT